MIIQKDRHNLKKKKQKRWGNKYLFGGERGP
jgi:hypothetical protein